VDNLHILAGNSYERTYQIHGNAYLMRCANGCCRDLYPIPLELATDRKGKRPTQEQVALLRCPRCDGRARPHVLWFDEIYDEKFFRFRSSLKAAAQADLLVVVGTSGSTNLPNQVAYGVLMRDKPIIDVNIEENPFSQMARLSGGLFLKETGAFGLKRLLDLFRAAI
jgi:NAD-dependent deacetylase